MGSKVIMAHVADLCTSLLDVVKCRDSPELVSEYSEPLKRLLEAVSSSSGEVVGSEAVKVDVVVPSLLVAAAHIGNHYWTNNDNRQLAKGILNQLASVCVCGSWAELLVGSGSDEKGVIKPILAQLKASLTREKWKDHPAEKQAMVWCVRHLSHPHLSPHLDTILPATLLLLDDHEEYHKVLGLNTATHIIKNVDPTELRWYGRAEVLYEAVKHLIHWSNADVIDALHPCLLALLPVLHPQPKTSPAKPNRTTEVFDTLLTSIQLESKVVSRKAYLSHVASYIEMLGIYSTRHLKLMVPTLLSCMEHPDYCGEYTRKYALSALATLIKHTWPRMPHHKEAILKALLQLVADLCPSSDIVPTSQEVQSQLQLVSLCLRLLGGACPDIKATYSSLLEKSFHAGLKHCLQRALAT